MSPKTGDMYIIYVTIHTYKYIIYIYMYGVFTLYIRKNKGSGPSGQDVFASWLAYSD